MTTGPRSFPANRCPHRLITQCSFGPNVVVDAFTNLDGCRVGADTRIGAFVEVQCGTRIGARCAIGSHSFICAGVTLDDEVLVGRGVVFVSQHDPHPTTEYRESGEVSRWPAMAAHIGHSARIGSGAVIIGDVDVGAGARISAGAVITWDVQPGAAAGDPSSFGWRR